MTPVRPRTEIAWGGIDQGLSSATNLGLSILAGRLLGAAGLGLIFLGFASSLFLLSLVRGFITSPFVLSTAALDTDEREAATRKCMTLVFGAAIAASTLMFAIGLVVPDPFGRGLLLFAPCVAAVVVQDLWRSVLFRDQRGAAAAFNDGVWAATMFLVLPFVWTFPHDWSVAAAWGVGALVAALVGFGQVGLRPSGLADATRWWKRELRRLGSWLAAESIIIAIESQVTIIILAAVLSVSDLGGIRVVQVVFAPMTLIGEAFHYPGVPIMARALASSRADARRWALRLGLGAVTLVGMYLAVVGPFRAQVLSRVFGPEFERFTSLVLPTALAQLVWAASIGFLILLKADQRVHAIVGCMAVNAAATLLLTPLLATWFGVLGAAWGLASGPAVGSAAAILCALSAHDIPLGPGRKRLISVER
jgi:O-antigen/teichoic acid export membrane protein